MLALHLVARLRSDRFDLRHQETAPVVWTALRRRFPDALIALLMPDHPHLVVPEPDAEAARARLANACGRIQRALGWPAGSWEPIPAPRPITKLRELRRHYRYVALNECRSGLARDPLEALWSTYREMFDVVADPWIDAPAVMRVLRAPRRNSLAWLHGFVSGDPTVAVDGTPLPHPARFGLVSTAPLGDVIRAAASSLRVDPSQIRERSAARRCFVGLARAVGWNRPALLAEVCGVTTRSIRRLAAEVDPRDVARAANCLGDPRLLARTPAIVPLPSKKRTKIR